MDPNSGQVEGQQAYLYLLYLYLYLLYLLLKQLHMKLLIPMSSAKLMVNSHSHSHSYKFSQKPLMLTGQVSPAVMGHKWVDFSYGCGGSVINGAYPV